MNASHRIVVIAGLLIPVLLVLVSAGSGSAAFRQFKAWKAQEAYLGNVCVDGATIGFWISAISSLRFRQVEIYREGEESSHWSEEIKTNWAELTSPFTAPNPWNPFCQSALDYGKWQGQDGLCTGIHYVEWEESLPVGTRLRIKLNDSSDGIDWASSGAPDWCEDMSRPETCWYFREAVADCRLGDVPISLTQVSRTPVNGWLMLEVTALDPDMPTAANGDGISSVYQRLIDPFGNIVHSQSDAEPPYCLFGAAEDHACITWDFAEHDYTWPSGQAIAPGAHRLQADIDAYYGTDRNVEWVIDIERTYWQHTIFFPYVNANQGYPRT